MVLVVTDSIDLSMVYATSLGGIMIGKQSIRRKNLEEHKALILSRASTDGYLTTFFRGEQYVFISLPFNAYALNRMMDYQEEYKALSSRPVPYIPTSFEYRCVDANIERFQQRIEGFCNEASSIVNATSDSMSGCLAFLRFQKMFQITKTITRARPNNLSEEKILEAFNAREDGMAFRDFGDACLLYERLNWLVNCNVSNAIMQANDGRVPMAAGRIEAVLLKVIERETGVGTGATVVYLKEKKTGFEIPCTAPNGANLSKGARAALYGKAPETQTGRNIGNCFSVLVRCGEELGMPLQAATDALWRLFINGYITWPSSSKAMPWSLKPALTVAVSQLAKQDRFKGAVSPGDVERYVGWDNEGVAGNRVATIVTAKSPSGLSGDDLAVYNMVGDCIVREVSQTEYIVPVFAVENIQMVAKQAIPTSVAQSANWVVVKVEHPGDAPYKDYCLLRDVLPFFSGALNEDFRYFIEPLSNLVTWRMVEKSAAGGFTVSENGQLLLKYISSTPLVDPGATTFWDKRLLRVANGQVSGTNVFAEVTPYINDLVAYVKVVVDAMAATGGIPPSECVCPLCGEALEWDSEKEGWSCSSTNSKQCSFFLPGTFRGHKLSVRDMALLLTRRESDMAFDFVGSKSGPFPARLVLNPQNQLALSFQSKCRCPKCKRNFLNEFQWGLSCPDKQCGFTANTRKSGVRLTEEDEIALFSGQRTRWIREFVSEQGKPFIARLYLTNDLKIKYEFPEKKTGGTGK